MCIRDSLNVILIQLDLAVGLQPLPRFAGLTAGQSDAVLRGVAEPVLEAISQSTAAVSYTHLTLPTSDLV